MLKKQTLLASFFVLFFASYSIAEAKKNIVVIATGGTIAGVGASADDSKYSASKVGVDGIIASVPNIANLANLKGEQLFQMSSENMNSETWLKIAKRVYELTDRNDVDGIVITHGTDTIEETAYFLNLVIKTKKPIVIVGAMRPSTSISADGPLNLYNAVAVAASSEARNKGVLVVFNDNIYNARDVAKTNTNNVATFASNNFGPIGNVYYGKVRIYFEPLRNHTNKSTFDVRNLTSLPKVDILYGYTNQDTSTLDALITNKTHGIVFAGVGDGNLGKDTLARAIEASKTGVKIVRSSRLGSGFVVRNAEINDDEYGFITADNLTPQKARILLMLSLTKTKDSEKIQNIFWSY